MIDRFWAKLPTAHRIDDGRWALSARLESCWEWRGARDGRGYGTLTNDLGRQVGAHRVSYEHFVGTVPDGARVLHKCDNRVCVNPLHLFVGSDADNMADRDAKHRQAHGEGHGRTRLTDGDVRAIRAAAGQISQTDMAAMYGISQVAVSMIIRRKTWAHVE